MGDVYMEKSEKEEKRKKAVDSETDCERKDSKSALAEDKNESIDKKCIIELRDVYKIYKMGDTEIRANDGINLKIYQNDMMAIVGQSGSGKSTIMNIIGMLDVPTKGEYWLSGHNVATLNDDKLAEIRNRTIGFIFQQYNLISNHNVLQNVELPLLYAGVKEKKRKEKAMEALEKVGLSDKYRHYPNQLSGGQQQRVSIARALVCNPSIILADEPTGALDSNTGKEVLSILKKLNEDGNTIILITHDNEIATQAKRVVKISDGKIVFDGETKEYINEFITNNKVSFGEYKE